MKYAHAIRRHATRYALPLLVLSALVPAAAQATQIQLTGTVTRAFAFGASPFSVGDPLSGLFDVDTAPGERFGLGDLRSFNLNVGPATFALTQANFGSFNGAISDSGALTDLSLVAASITPMGITGMYMLGANGVMQPLAIVGSGPGNFGSITEASFRGQAVPMASDVPEPSSLGLLALALAGVGFAALRRRRSAGLSATAAV